MFIGCATVGRHVITDLKSAPQEKGLALFSTGAKETNLAFSTGLTLIEGVSLKKYDKVIMNFDYPFASHFPNEHGHLRSLILPEGDYYLAPTPGNPAFVMVEFPVFKFHVKKGEISYLGDLFLSGSRIQLTNDFENRDLNLFLSKNPSLQRGDIASGKMEIHTQFVSNKPNSFYIKGIIWDLP